MRTRRGCRERSNVFDVSDNRRPGSSSLAHGRRYPGGCGLSRLRPCGRVSLARPPGAFNPHSCALHERKAETDPQRQAGDIACPEPEPLCLGRLFSLPHAQSVALAREAAPAEAWQPPRLLAREARRKPQGSPVRPLGSAEGSWSPGSLSASKRARCVVLARHGAEAGASSRYVCRAARGIAVVLFCVWSAVPERGDTTTHNRVARPGQDP